MEINGSPRAVIPEPTDYFEIVPKNLLDLEAQVEKNRVKCLKERKQEFLLGMPKISDCDDEEKRTMNKWFRKLNGKQQDVVIQYYRPLGRKDVRKTCFFPGYNSFKSFGDMHLRSKNLTMTTSL